MPALPPSVLIVDAEPHHTRVFQAKLARNGAYIARTALNEADALSCALEQPFDVVLWDTRLRDTASMLPRIRALCPTAAVLLMTTDDRPVIPEHLARLGIADLLVKPIGLDTLVERIEAARQLPKSDMGARTEFGYIGQSVRFFLRDESFETQIWEVGPQNFTVIAPPRAQAGPSFKIGERVMGEILGDDALYRFVTRISGEASTTPVPAWEVRMPTIIRRLQRRSALRSQMRVPVSFSVGDLLMNGFLQDVSLTGMKALIDGPLEPGLAVTFEPQSTESGITGAARVVRVERSQSPEDSGYAVAFEFTSLEPGAAQFIESLA